LARLDDFDALAFGLAGQPHEVVEMSRIAAATIRVIIPRAPRWPRPKSNGA
jgi:hypothetical protein